MLPVRQRRRLLDPDHVVFQPEIRIDVLLVLKCPAMIREPFANVSTPRYAENSCGVFRTAPPQILEMLHVGFANFPQQQALQPGTR
jgi:hypothetical protein